jgi:hypothetical protein
MSEVVYGVHSELTIGDRTLTVLDWSRQPECRVPLLTLLGRLNAGVEPAQALRRTVRCRRPRRERGAHKQSAYRGVSWHRASGLWLARVYDPDLQKVFPVGYFEDELDAAKAYDRSARERLGRSAKLNFREPVASQN